MGTKTINHIKIVRQSNSMSVPQTIQKEANPSEVKKKRGITMIPVSSSNLESIGYNPATQELAVKFQKNDTVYISVDVPPEIFVDFMNASSKGSFFAHNIKGKYDGRRITH